MVKYRHIRSAGGHLSSAATFDRQFRLRVSQADMGIENVKTWQWMLIGAVVGMTMAYIWSSNRADLLDVSAGGDQASFERDIQFQDPRSGKPLVSDVIVYPPIPSFQGSVNLVTYKRLAQDPQGRLWWLDRHMIARIPFKPSDPRLVSGETNLTIEKFLTTMSAQHAFIHFHYAWWLEPAKSLVAGAIAGVVVIGILWPSLLSLLAIGGLVPQREATEKKPSLFSVRSTSTSVGKSSPKVTAADEQQLRDITAAYQQNLPVTEAPTVLIAPTESAEVRKLEGGTLEKAAEMKKEEDDVEVKGEYYPVLIHHKKASDTKKPQ
jgi:hypothetical protein